MMPDIWGFNEACKCHYLNFVTVHSIHTLNETPLYAFIRKAWHLRTPRFKLMAHPTQYIHRTFDSTVSLQECVCVYVCVYGGCAGVCSVYKCNLETPPPQVKFFWKIYFSLWQEVRKNVCKRKIYLCIICV